MCDIKTEPENSICRGCLSTDRRLSPLTNYDLYWSCLKEDQKLQALSMQYVAMCWECRATLHRLQTFQAQVQRAHAILQDLEDSGTAHTLSPLTVHLKHEYDTIFKEKVEENSQKNIPGHIVQSDTPTKHDDVKDNTNVSVNLEEEKDKRIKSNSSYNYFSKQNHMNDSDNFTNDDECRDISSDNDSENFGADDIVFISTETTTRRSVRHAAKKCSQLIQKPKQKDESLRRKLGKQKKHYVNIPVKPAYEFIQTQVSEKKLGTPINVEKKREPIKVLQSEAKQVPLIKNPLLVKLEQELKKMINAQKTIPKCKENKTLQNSEQKTNGKEMVNKVPNDVNVIEFSDDEFSEIEFSDKDADGDNNDVKDTLTKNKKSKAHQNSNQRNKNDEMGKTDSKYPKKNNVAKSSNDDELSETDFDDKDRDNDGNKDGNEVITESQDDLQSNSEDSESNHSEYETKKRKNKKPDSDPEFIPEKDDEEPNEVTNVGEKEKDEKLKPHKYNKVYMQYDTIADVLDYFTETEMSEQEIKITLEREDAIVYERKPHKCNVCGQSFKSRKTLLTHLKWGHGKKNLSKFQDLEPPGAPQKPCLWRCNTCPRMLRRAHLVAHINEHHRLRYSCNGQGCEWSPKLFMSREDFEQHWLDIHRKFVCELCGHRTKAKINMTWHLQETHVQKLRQQCSICGCKLLSERALKKHVDSKHGPPKPAELRYCVECDITYKTVAHYRRHLSVVHEPHRKEWPCSVCGRVLLSRGSLENHSALYHAGTTKYQCDVCGKYFAYSAGLRSHHRNIHSNVKKPKTEPCSICGRMFTTKRILRHHMYTHTGERPYKCVHCDVGFTQPHCLRMHLVKQHGDTHTRVSATLTPADEMLCPTTGI